MEPQEVVEDWNASYPIGTPVVYQPVKGDPARDNKQTKTRSSAWVLGGHTPVVMVEGIAGGVAIEHCFPKVEPVEAP
jgi:hypothetical protein